MIDVGQVYRATFDIDGDDGLPAQNVATVTVKVTKPDLSTETPPVENPPEQAGHFTVDYKIAAEGLYTFSWASTGPDSQKTDVAHARIWRSAVSLGEARDFLNEIDTRRDELIRSMMLAALEEAEKIAGTIVPKVITGEWVNGQYKDVIQFQQGPLLSKTAPITLTSVYAGGPRWVNDDNQTDLLPNTAAGTIRPADMLGFWWGPWEASYTAGRAVIDESLRLGVLEILWDLWAIQRGATGDESEPSVSESEAFEYQVPAGYSPPPRARALLAPYERPGFG